MMLAGTGPGPGEPPGLWVSQTASQRVLTGCVPVSEALNSQNLGFVAVTSQLVVHETHKDALSIRTSCRDHFLVCGPLWRWV